MAYSNCTNGQMRLSGGETSLQGRVELCYNSIWYGVCADNYNIYNKPAVICGALGISHQGTK